MALCGAPRACQCAIGPADIGTGGEVNGTFPTIEFLGDGSVGNPYKPLLNPAWATAVVAGMSPKPWIAFPFLNGFANYGAPHQVCQYRKIGDIVYLRGAFARAGASNGLAVGNLPAGYRPPANGASDLLYPVDQSGILHARIDVGSNGDVIVRYNSGDVTFCTLNGVTFSTAPGP